MKARLILLLAVIVVSLAAAAPRAEAADYIPIGPDPCNFPIGQWLGGYYYYGPYCGTPDSWHSYRMWHAYDASGRFLNSLVCWSTPIQNLGCDWRY